MSFSSQISDFWNQYGTLLVSNTGVTLYMVFVSTLVAYVIGIPMGIGLVVTAPNGLCSNKVLYRILDTITNIVRSIPFLILLILIMPLTKKIVGVTFGSTATIVPLVVSAAPFIARMVESSLLEVDKGVIEAAQSMGASNFTIVFKVMITEARTSLIIGVTIALATILGYSAMAGSVGGGGLGDVAIQYGYYRYKTEVMIITVVLLVVLVQVMQAFGMWLGHKLDRRSIH
ncbi:methionine ABC transporter permease [Butyrivibrio sp. NC3005]|uniref:methionine ABC transporter permease n=1 Tax=Butyrivibrio sp. NC3005 TaxID=1280685 RepID=UPI0003F698D2|nr:methionine ABC transporter permease [Butyrivibrio sp. NC3005]